MWMAKTTTAMPIALGKTLGINEKSGMWGIGNLEINRFFKIKKYPIGILLTILTPFVELRWNRNDIKVDSTS